ncbi:ion transporter [Thiorhodospira sibirica]|uniref:ion transporter n=1 Tax=Thiorhodospira sibirica TaxID=154347 RepID=UPI00022C0B0A|nr:ion transporter [Thiorhodospira sibirica]
MAEHEGLRKRMGVWIESAAIQRLIIILILVNALILGLQTSVTLMTHFGSYLIWADRLILSVFVIELLIKLFALDRRFFKNPWNVFDLVVVSLALIPSTGPLSVLRVLRLLRLVSLLPKLRFVVEALLRAIPGIISIIGLLGLLYYVFAVIATGLFGQQFPDWFGTLGKSMYTLFQIMTLESWSMGIARPVLESYPYAWLFFIPFILVATFTILNLFIAIIVSTMQSMQEEQRAIEQQAISKTLHDDSAQIHADLLRTESENQQLREELRAVREDIRALRELLAKQNP